jgi:hypothetical protein
MAEPDGVIIKIGDPVEEIEVPHLVWYNLRRLEGFFSEKQSKPDESNYDLMNTAVTVIAEALVLIRPDCTKEYLEQKIYGDQAGDFYASYIKLLQKSGFNNLGEAIATSVAALTPGTGMSNGLSQNALPEASTAETGIA